MHSHPAYVIYVIAGERSATTVLTVLLLRQTSEPATLYIVIR